MYFKICLQILKLIVKCIYKVVKDNQMKEDVETNEANKWNNVTIL